MKTSEKLGKMYHKGFAEMAFTQRFIQSLDNNPLAIKLIFDQLQTQSYPSIKDFVLAAWLGKLKIKSPKDTKTKSKFPVHASIPGFKYAMPRLESLEKLMLYSLVPFNERLPKNLNDFFEFQLGHGLVNLDVLDDLVIDAEERSTKPKLSGETSTSLLSLQKPFSNVITFLKDSGMITNEDANPWVLHPLLPYLLQEGLGTFQHSYRDCVRRAFFAFHLTRSVDQITIHDGQKALFRKESSELLEREFINFISAAWVCLNFCPVSEIDFPFVIFDWLSLKYFFWDNPSDKNPGNIEIVFSLCLDLVELCTKGIWHWKVANFASRALRRVTFQPLKSHYIQAHEEHQCSCQNMIEALEISFCIFIHSQFCLADKEELRLHLQ